MTRSAHDAENVVTFELDLAQGVWWCSFGETRICSPTLEHARIAARAEFPEATEERTVIDPEIDALIARSAEAATRGDQAPAQRLVSTVLRRELPVGSRDLALLVGLDVEAVRRMARQAE